MLRATVDNKKVKWKNSSELGKGGIESCENKYEMFFRSCQSGNVIGVIKYISGSNEADYLNFFLKWW